ncbi:hypothetical protein JCM10207_002917 [Rhodosporidiobolus poonsookiae]
MDLERFVDPLPEYLHCPICLEAAYVPIVVCPQEHVVCQACYANLLHSPPNRQSCPTCRHPCTYRNSPAFKRAIESFKIRCKERRCKWTGFIGDEAGHIANQCNYRPMLCGDCGKEHTLADEERHRADCPNVYLSCVRGGADCGGVTGGGVFMRKNAAKHDATCSNYRCTVTPACYTRTTRKNLPVHEAQCADAQRRIKTLEAELAALKKPAAKRGRAPGVDPGMKGRATASDVPSEIDLTDDDVSMPGELRRRKIAVESPFELAMGASVSGNRGASSPSSHRGARGDVPRFVPTSNRPASTNRRGSPLSRPKKRRTDNDLEIVEEGVLVLR